LANFANIDVVGHIENEAAIKKAMESVDFQLGRCLQAAGKAEIITLITSEHGTMEKWQKNVDIQARGSYNFQTSMACYHYPSHRMHGKRIRFV